jgi:5-methylcytosine-specific restriction endonuclease McrA
MDNEKIIEWCKENYVEIPNWIQIKRQPIKPSLRFEILKRDNYRCQMCGVTAKDGATLEIDHIYPVSKGGTNELDNLQVLCRECNAGKGAQCQ